MNEEIKAELIDIKKIEAVIDRHSSKIETIFIDVEKKFTEFDQYGDVAKDLKRSFEKLQSDVDKLRVKAEEKADKDELAKFVTKFNDFEKHTSNLINILDERSKSAVDNLKNQLDMIRRDAQNTINAALKQLNVNVESIAPAPDQAQPREQAPAEQPAQAEQAKPEEKKGMFSFMKKS